MASFAVEEIAPDVDSVFEASKIHKNRKKSKKPKKERKDRSKTKHAADILLEDGCHETAYFTQMHECRKRKKAKKKKMKPEEDFQLPPRFRTPKSENQLKQSSSSRTRLTQDTHLIHTQSVIGISPDQAPKHSSKSGCLNRVKEVENDKSKKRVLFNLPPEPSQAANTSIEPFTTRNVYNFATSLPRAICFGNVSQGKQLVGESSLESQTTVEESNSQDLFITQKSFSEPYVNLSSSASGNDVTIVSVQDEHSCRMTTEAYTQTENFFTCPEFASCLRFQQQKKSTCTEEPMDLSLPKRARRAQRPDRPAKHPVADCMNQQSLYAPS